MLLEISKVSGDIARKNIFVFLKYTKRNLEVNETFVEKNTLDEVALHADGPHFDPDKVNTSSNVKGRRNTTNDFDSIDFEILISELLLKLREIFENFL